MPSTPQKRALALEIPLISDLMCRDLTRNDILACVQVSHLWRDVFQPQLDRFVRLDTNPRKNPPHHIRTIIDRATQIRSLQIDISDGVWFLPKDHDPVIAARSGSTTCGAAGRCINLEELSCLDFGYQPCPSKGEEGYFYHAPDRPSIIHQSSNALRLIQYSPKLRFLYIHHARQFYRTDHFTTEVLEAISNHKSLRRIKIHLDYAVDAEFRIRLLQHLPEGIEDFELVCRPSQVSTPPPPRVIAPPPLLSLKRLCLLSNIPRQSSSSGSNSGTSKFSYWDQTKFIKDDFSEFRYSYPDWLIIPLTKQSPHLSKLAIAGYHGYPNTLLQSLVGSCPDLDTIHLGGTNFTHHPTMYLPRDIPFIHDDEGTVVRDRTPLRGVFSRLQEFMATGFSNNLWSDSGYEDVSGLLVRSTETLERVVIQSDDGSWNYPTPFRVGLRGAGLSWADCKKLKELTIEPISRMDFSFLDRPAATPPLNDDNGDDDNIINLAIADNNSINTSFKSLTHLRLTTLGDTSRHNCSSIFLDYSRHWFQDPTLDDYLELPPHKYSEAIMRSYHHHRLLFIRRMRELFGRLKSVGTLKRVDLDWSELCMVVKSMTQEMVLDLLKETEDQEPEQQGKSEKEEEEEEKEKEERDVCTRGDFDKGKVARSCQGWYGQMTLDDLAWLGLQWPTRAAIVAEKAQGERSMKK
ncbi:hypothetical protein BG015_003585 [Linnemannia schmuckeri]|uniref:Uncharacterized protein n=1 Tax=Linnemannia schmuckeri TaxID=64567 RepID=A0A9P5S967_9FUNG|nr:hypothetical protein BG015_003585 [Linnemannia schmuckeri]